MVNGPTVIVSDCWSEWLDRRSNACSRATNSPRSKGLVK